MDNSTVPLDDFLILEKYAVTSRPYPFDLERKQKVERAMFDAGIRSVSELAKRLKMNYTSLSEIINGTRLSRKAETRIAAFLKRPAAELFTVRTPLELAKMNKKQIESNGGRVA
ncbi:transcriptional regulator [Treponema phagedenis]|uniref:Transcriptional regulator n=1 Tax=Treponema phagedenis TaxID=162 RepID=A0AAE6M6S3_TREPH|nr:transcriptional regulator [Treponema phagedenis]QEJ93782.1 transcriptional regulator [Treponema phagedenis]QEJ94141.1 transcriptional regulator [Treponema phagedenis]QEJ94394.1 transcriptional regulator [Treponema phagedenis]QEJ96118.1 transcriptional regulator [Treponema phagedenis]QEJ96990.1 transcriptional regulator [Treponema phagedenis]